MMEGRGARNKVPKRMFPCEIGSESNNPNNKQKKENLKLPPSPQQEDTEEPQNMEDELLCTCKQPYDKDKFMVGCDFCEEWFHTECLGMRFENEEASKGIIGYVCTSCQDHYGEDIPGYEYLKHEVSELKELLDKKNSIILEETNRAKNLQEELRIATKAKTSKIKEVERLRQSNTDLKRVNTELKQNPDEAKKILSLTKTNY